MMTWYRRVGLLALIQGRILTLALIGASACGRSESTDRDTAALHVPAFSEARADQQDSYGLKSIQGRDFTIAVPREAVVERQADSVGHARWHVRAPAQTITATTGTADTTQFSNDIPLYELKISTARKPATESLKAWGDGVVAAHEAAADELTKGESGEMQMVAGEPAYLRHPTCGDCGIDIFTFARGDRLVEVEYTRSTNEPLGVRKQGIYALILSTFRWTLPPTP